MSKKLREQVHIVIRRCNRKVKLVLIVASAPAYVSLRTSLYIHRAALDWVTCMISTRCPSSVGLRRGGYSGQITMRPAEA